MKNDNIIYYLFRECPSLFFELIGEPVETAAQYQFSAVASERSATRIDGVFLPKQKDNNYNDKQSVKTDSIFYRVFQEFPNIFFELINSPPEMAENYQFSSVKLKQTAFWIDSVFQPIQDNDNHIYFVEVQFQPDSDYILDTLLKYSCIYANSNLKRIGMELLYFPVEVQIREKLCIIKSYLIVNE